MGRDQRAQQAQQTLSAIQSGGYTAPSGRHVDLSASLQALRRDTIAYAPGQFPSFDKTGTETTRVEVTGESTLAAAARLAASGAVIALNFASAKNPGGGFLSGAQAQEESLARASTLYASLQGQPLYELNRRQPSNLYTDHMIYSPHVAVFRDDHGAFLEQPYFASFLTAPAANAGALKDSEQPLLEGVMSRRTELVLTVAAAHGYTRLVLGAWGCGVFRNDPTRVAGWFAQALNGRFRNVFSHVVFAVYDRPEGRTMQAFQRAFG